MISIEKSKILTPLQQLPTNVGDLGKLIVAKGFKIGPKSNKSPNLVTLLFAANHQYTLQRKHIMRLVSCSSRLNLTKK